MRRQSSRDTNISDGVEPMNTDRSQEERGREICHTRGETVGPTKPENDGDNGTYAGHPPQKGIVQSRADGLKECIREVTDIVRQHFWQPSFLVTLICFAMVAAMLPRTFTYVIATYIYAHGVLSLLWWPVARGWSLSILKGLGSGRVAPFVVGLAIGWALPAGVPERDSIQATLCIIMALCSLGGAVMCAAADAAAAGRRRARAATTSSAQKGD